MSHNDPFVGSVNLLVAEQQKDPAQTATLKANPSASAKVSMSPLLSQLEKFLVRLFKGFLTLMAIVAKFQGHFLAFLLSEFFLGKKTEKQIKIKTRLSSL